MGYLYFHLQRGRTLVSSPGGADSELALNFTILNVLT